MVLDTKITIVDLLDKDGRVVGYATGTAQETHKLSQSVWTPTATTAKTMCAATDVLKAAMTTRVQDTRRAAESNGVTINGNVFATDIGSQVKMVAALVQTLRDPTFSVIWKTLDNKYITLEAKGLSDACTSMLQYIQTCYSWEQTLLGKIDAAKTVTELQAIDMTADKPKGTLPDTLAVIIPPLPMTASALTVAGDSVLNTLTVGAVKSASVDATGALTSATATMSGLVTAGNVTCKGLTTSKKLKGGSAIPTVVRGLGSGLTSTVTMVTGSNDSAGQLSVATAGLVTTLAGTVIATVTFNTVYSTAPFVIMQPTSATAGALQCQPFVTVTTAGFAVCVSGSSGLVTGTTYTWAYHVIQ